MPGSDFYLKLAAIAQLAAADARAGAPTFNNAEVVASLIQAVAQALAGGSPALTFPSAAPVATASTAISTSGGTSALVPYGKQTAPFAPNISPNITRPPIAWPSRLTNQGSYATSGTNLGGTSRFGHYVQRSAAGLQLVFENFYPAAGNDLTTPANASTITIQAVIEYPVDTFWPVYFRGQSSVTLALGSVVVSDPVGIEVTAGSVLWARTYVQAPNPGAIPIGCFSGNNDGTVTSGGGVTFATDGTQSGDNYPSHAAGSGVNALTTAGQAWLSAAGQFSYGHSAIIGKATNGATFPVVGFVGDSIIDGSIDVGHDFGYLMRACVAAGFGYHRICRGGENGVFPVPAAWNATLGHVVRSVIGEACTHIVWAYGTNDLAAGTANWNSGGNQFYPAVLAGWKLLQQHMPVPFFATTITPRVSGIGSNAAAQTPVNALFESTRQSYNAWLRAPASAGAGLSAAFDCAAQGIIFTGVIDCASYVETNALNAVPGGATNPNLGGRWYCGPANNSASDSGYGSDGVHPTDTGHIAMIPSVVAALF